jgi:hypothetical protein
MASNNSKISELTALVTVATGDKLPIVDISDLTDATTGTTKRITWGELMGAPGAIGGTTAGTVRSLFDEDAAITTGALSANQCSGGLISNYNQSDDTTMTVPTAFAGGNFIVALSTAVAKYYRLDPTGSEVWVWDGVAQAAGKYIGVAAATVGAALQFISIQTGASAWTWHVYTVAGAWDVEG